MGAPAETVATELEAVYEATARRVREFLSHRYPLQPCPPESADYPPEGNWREVWSISIKTGEGLLTLLLAIPLTFPDKLPTIYIPVELAQQAIQIPHLNDQRHLCTVDTTEVAANADRPEDITLVILSRAKAIWCAGIAGENQDEYESELLAYWEQGLETQALSLLSPEDPAQEIIQFHLSPRWAGFSWLFAKTRVEGQAWLENMGFQGRFWSTPALYLHLNNLRLPPYPATNGDLYKQLQREDPDALVELCAFLSKKDRPTATLFTVPSNEQRVFGAWSHPQLLHTVHGSKGLVQVPGAMPGFRPSRHPIKQELLSFNSHAALWRASVTRVDKSRLFARTCGTAVAESSRRVNMVGLGSLGGFLADGLARSGIGDTFGMIDLQPLSAENIVRHYCGMADVGRFKTRSVASQLKRHFPHVTCTTYEKDVLELLRKKPDVLHSGALTVSSIGNFAVERRLNRLLSAGNLCDSPLCFVWAEPHLFAGHALLLFPEQPGCFECLLDENLLFSERVVIAPGKFSQREAGCQSTFIPYSGIDTVAFTSAVVRFLVQNLTSKTSLLFSWVGDLDTARSMRIELGQAWKTAVPYTTLVRPILGNPSCPVCAS